jgi:hypothetical protein
VADKDLGNLGSNPDLEFIKLFELRSLIMETSKYKLKQAWPGGIIRGYKTFGVCTLYLFSKL